MTTRLASLLVSVIALACGSPDEPPDDQGPPPSEALYSVGTIVTEPTGRSLYVQTVDELRGSFGLENAIEVPGNSRHWAYDGAVYVGFGQEPRLQRYVPGPDGRLEEAGRIGLQSFGITGLPPGLVFVSPEKAYLLLHEALTVVIFDPTEMEILGEIDLSSLLEEGFSIETWFPTLHDGRIYVPVRAVNYITFEIIPTVRVAILDTTTDELLAVVDDERCVAASRPAVGPDGHVYVLGEGRNYVTQALAAFRELPVPPTCMLRIRQGETEFDPDYFVDMEDVTGGLNAATAMWQVPEAPGVGFAKMIELDELPDDVVATGPNLWGFAIYKFWRLELGDEITAVEVESQPFSTIDFGGVPVDGQLYFGVGDTTMGGATTVYRIDPATNEADAAFELIGSLREIFRLR